MGLECSGNLIRGDYSCYYGVDEVRGSFHGYQLSEFVNDLAGSCITQSPHMAEFTWPNQFTCYLDFSMGDSWTAESMSGAEGNFYDRSQTDDGQLSGDEGSDMLRE